MSRFENSFIVIELTICAKILVYENFSLFVIKLEIMAELSRWLINMDGFHFVHLEG